MAGEREKSRTTSAERQGCDNDTKSNRPRDTCLPGTRETPPRSAVSVLPHYRIQANTQDAPSYRRAIGQAAPQSQCETRHRALP